MSPRKKRLTLILVGVALLASAVALVLSAFQENLVFFVTPSDIAQGKAQEGRYFRVGGLVEAGSIQRGPDGVTVTFRITDTAHALPVVYRGALPDLFGENQGAVAEGVLRPDGVFEAKKVLAKHDETYMPPEASHAVDQAQRAAQSLKE
ncbi:MAG: cytochrome c maturation protein CcmE [Hydrogenophilus thermoluteolus]|jgi:cytochrome c-type biogenesis protein CcmE|nr:cytochrome c maturation protein CcmE [Hydrogenophilus thermoluteolus]MBW7657318.1 cytochrome c maturation protein CcmE [Hydrogenophilus thermoluteolus]HCO76962.1 cytochrome c maturation protein CcmE [Rhodocyclaceae bacterium]HNQ49210.1 cytochrome c maturation protein CcmE [Hydrogenophilus thermoluteolus]HNU18980.1 cytochrome c maturation protein CcmE [Hydrogenophilus thermoluteolus]